MSDFMLRLATTTLPALVVGTASTWLAFSVARRRSGPAAARLAATRALLATVVATLLVWTLLLSNPDAADAKSLNLVPFREIARALRSEEASYTVVNLWGNVLVFVPLGALIALSIRRSARCAGTKAFASGVGLSVAIEAAQFGIGRSADVDDVILNAVGVAVGVAGAALARRLLGQRPSSADEPS